MTNLFYLEEKEILPVITDCFATDNELLDKWHISAPCDLETAVRKTYYDLKTVKDFRFFVMYGDKAILGFWGSEKLDDEITFLTSFFVKPQYRNKEIIKFFWQSIRKEIGETFFTSIYEKNERAKNFLENNGFELLQVTETNDNKLALVYKNN